MNKNGKERLKHIISEIDCSNNELRNRRKQQFALGKEKMEKLITQGQNEIVSRTPYIDYCDYSNYNDSYDGNWNEDNWNDNWDDCNE